MGKDHYDRGARGHRRDRPRRRGDDVLDRRRVRARRVHGRRRRPVVQAVRAHDRLRRCSCRCSCRSRSTRCSRPTGPTRRSRRTSGAVRSRARSTASTLVRPAGASATSASIAWALDHRLAMIALAVGVVRRRASPCQVGDRRRRLRSRSATAASSTSPSRRRRARASSTRASRREQVARHGARASRGAYTYTTIGSASGSGGVDDGTVYVRLDAEARARRRASRSSAASCARELKQHRRRDGVPCSTRRLRRRQQADPAPAAAAATRATLAELAEQSRPRCSSVPGAVDVGLSTQGPEARARRRRSTAASPARSA